MLSTTWHILAYLTAASALIPLAFSLFSDRSRGRRRCPKCWYTLDGLTPTSPLTYTCPECAHQSPETRLYKTRIRYRLLPLPFIILAISYTLWAIPRVMKEGWTGWVPTTALVVTVAGPDLDPLAIHSKTFGKLRETLYSRRDTKQAWHWQLRLWQHAREAIFSINNRHGPSTKDRRAFDTLTSTTLCYTPSQPQSIADFCEQVTQATASPVLFDTDDIKEWSTAFNTPIEFPPRCTALGALDHVFRHYLKPLDPNYAWRIENGAIHVLMHDEPESTLLCVYDINDILPARDIFHPDYWMSKCGMSSWELPGYFEPVRMLAAEDLIQTIESITTPTDWFSNGGDKAEIAHFANHLVVVATSRTHFELDQLFIAIRAAEGMTPGELHPGRLQAARDLYRRLAESTIRFDQPRVTLAAALTSAAAQSGIPIETAWTSLEHAVITPDTQCVPQVGPWTGIEFFGRAVGVSDPNSGLDLWTPDICDGAIVVVPTLSANDTMMTVVYDIQDFTGFQARLELKDHGRFNPLSELAREVSDIIISTIDVQSWIDNGGDLASIHPLGHKLIIQARPFTQARIADLLDMIRAHRGQPEINW